MTLKFLWILSRLLTNRVTKKRKDGDKMEHYIYWGIVIQVALITSHLLWDWPNLYFMLLPGMIIIGSYFVILTALLIGAFRVNADQITKKRYQIGIAGIATFFLLLFLIHITDKFFRRKSVSDVLLCIEFLIPEVVPIFAIPVFSPFFYRLVYFSPFLSTSFERIAISLHFWNSRISTFSPSLRSFAAWSRPTSITARVCACCSTARTACFAR